ncbi:MAG TPA: hypothetical protein VHU81_12540 [Thermoanaerobaculia bacterium]|nr:hypothetical protein [Thermoanaerobaculia bacterium]
MIVSTPWRGLIGCEGGPVIVANLADFLYWRGAEPFPDSERRELHLWSPFTSELPDRFHPGGPRGHQFIPAPDHAALEDMRDELFRFVVTKWPGTVVTQEHERWIARRPDGAALNVKLDPTSEYDRCIRDLEEVKIHTFDAGRCCLVWSVEPGIVNIVRAAPRQLLLVQTRYADDDEQAESAVQNAIEQARAHDEAGEVSFTIKPATVVVSWAPNSALDCRVEALQEQHSSTVPGVLLDLATAESGALLGMPPGAYGVTVGEWTDQQSCAAWCALTWRGEPG